MKTMLHPLLNIDDDTFTYAAIQQLFDFFAKTPLHKQLQFNCDMATISVGGTHLTAPIYKNISFLVTSRYELDGELYIAGDKFELNLTDLVSRMQSLLEARED